MDNPSRAKIEVRSCRSALVNLAADNPLRPRLRDLRTNEVLADATDQEHAEAYLQFDVHAKWILEFFLARHNVRIPRCGIQVRFFLLFFFSGNFDPAKKPLPSSVCPRVYIQFLSNTSYRRGPGMEPDVAQALDPLVEVQIQINRRCGPDLLVVVQSAAVPLSKDSQLRGAGSGESPAAPHYPL